MNIQDLQNIILSVQSEDRNKNMDNKILVNTILLLICILIPFSVIGIMYIILQILNPILSSLPSISIVFPIWIQFIFGVFFMLLLFFLFLTYILTIPAKIKYTYNFFINFYKEVFIGIYTKNIDILEKSVSVNTIEEILTIMTEIGYLINKHHRYKFLFQIVYNHNTINKYNSIVILEIKWLNLVLTDLRSDLATRLTEQQEILKSAKSEVEKNIQGTTELEQVSELQKTRLDRQIEQFEELQSVLVRV